MRLIRLSALSLCLLFLPSCSRSPAAQLKIELQTISSWTATARMVGEEWTKGNVPHAYAVQTLRAASETLQEEMQAIQEQQQPEGARQLQATLAAEARSVGLVIDQMRAAVERRDVEMLSRLLKQLEAEEQAIKGLSEGGGARP